MTTIVTRAGKGSPLTNAEVDQNFLNLNSAKLEASDLSPYLLSATAASTYQTIAGMSSYQVALISGTNIKTINGSSLLGSGDFTITAGVSSFNTRTGAITLTSGDVTTALGFTPLNKAGDSPTGLIEFLSTNFALEDDTDPTKRAVFGLSGITTGTTRTYTLPNADGTVALLSGTQTFSSATTFSTTTGALNFGTSQSSGAFTVGGTSGTGTITLGRSTASQTTNIQAGATASGSTKTINFGTGGLTGSTTAMTIGSTFGTTVAANGTWTFGTTISGSISGNAGTVTDGVYTTGSYANPAWITSLAYSKLTGAPTNVSSFTNDSGYLTGITSGQVTTALGFTPYNATNPSGYITSSALSPYLLSTTAASTYLPLAGGTLTGNLTFNGTNQRIIGDFTSATRLFVQTSTSNGNTFFALLPNGTSTNSQLQVFGSSDAANAAYGTMTINATALQIQSAAVGTGTALPFRVLVSSTEVLRATTGYNLLIGSSTDNGADKLQVTGSISVSSAVRVGATPSAGTTGQVLTSQGAGAAPVWATPSGVTTGKSIAMAIVFGG